jgi:hypothetical protein
VTPIGIYPINDFGDNQSLAYSMMIPQDENLYFYLTTGGELESNPVYGVTNSNRVGKSNTRESQVYDQKFTILQFDAKDMNGIKTNNVGSIHNNDMEIVKNMIVGTEDLNPSKFITSNDAVSSTSYSQPPIRKKYMSSILYPQDNGYSQNYPASTSKIYKFFVKANKKFTINLQDIFNQDREKILPTLYSNYKPFNSVFIVKGRTVSASKSYGSINVNYEEQV